MAYQLGMGPVWYQRPETEISKCNERAIAACENDCCAIIPCQFCLTFTDDYGGIDYGVMLPIADREFWHGTVSGLEVQAYWAKDIYGVCTFYVTVDGTIVFEKVKCEFYAAAPCRAPNGSTAIVTEEYVPRSGLLEWEVTPYLKLDREIAIQDGEYQDAECAKYFCGTCDCTCPELCVEVTKFEYGSEDILCTGSGKITSVTQPPCVSAVDWMGDVACGYEIISVHVSLSPDEYTHECNLTLHTDVGDFMLPVVDCRAIDQIFSYTDANGDDVEIRILCSECGECKPQTCPDCVCGDDHPVTTLYLTITPRAACCTNMAGTHTFSFIGIETNNLGECESRFRGVINGEVFIYSCQGETFSGIIPGQPDLMNLPVLEVDTCKPFYRHWVVQSPSGLHGRCAPDCIDYLEEPIDIYLTS